MKIQPKMLAGVAVFATLALAGMIGVFAFSAAQPLQAQAMPSTTPSATRSLDISTVAPGGQVMVKITAANTGGNPWYVTETLPAGFTTSDGDALTGMPNARKFRSLGGPTITYTVTVGGSVADGDHTISGILRARPGDAPATDHTIADSTVAVASDGGNGGIDGNGGNDGIDGMTSGSVNARPKDPGDIAQITVKFETSMFLAIDESITLEVSDDLGVPGRISASDVSISGMGAESGAENADKNPESASPHSVIVETDPAAERYSITLNIGNMDDSVDRRTDKGLAAGPVTVVFRQGAGLTNRTEGGSDDWFVKTSQEDLLDSLPMTDDHDEGQIPTVYTVPHTISLSSYADSRGEEITVIGKGFKNDTTTRFWRDANGDGTRDTDETVLCEANANSDDVATCKFTLSNPPFAPETMGNYINAEDGHGFTATMPLKVIELEPSLSVNPSNGNPGDSINVQLHDFQTGATVTRIEFARSVDVCDSDAATIAIPPCQSIGAAGQVSSNGSLSFSFEIPNSVSPGIQDLRVHTSSGNDNITFTVGSGELELSTTNVLPNQRISVSGRGFTKSSNSAPAWIGDPGAENNSCAADYEGAVTLGGQGIMWERINDGDPIEVTSGGTWSAPIDLPINSSTTPAGTRALKITDCRRGEATVDLTFAKREVRMMPAEGGVGTDVIITGKNYPASNDDGTKIEVKVEYDADAETDDDDVEPDALGNFTVILEVPEDAGIPSNNTVSVRFNEDDGSEVLDTFTHRVPQGTVSFSVSQGTEGSALTIKAKGFARYTRVDLVEFGNREITPTPSPSTDTNGNAKFSVKIPGSDPGIYIIRVEIDTVVATSTFTVISGAGADDTKIETVLGNLISEDALDRVFRFDNATKDWEWYVTDPVFAPNNNLVGLSSGNLVFIKVTQDITADILGTSVALTCVNEGTEAEDCWNTITIP